MVSTRIPSRLVVVIVAAVSWFAVGCSKSNTVTGPMATATPIPRDRNANSDTDSERSVARSPHGWTAPSGVVPVNGATVSVQQGSRISHTTSNPDGFYVVFGLEAGVASVTATGTLGGGPTPVMGTATITLQIGLSTN